MINQFNQYQSEYLPKGPAESSKLRAYAERCLLDVQSSEEIMRDKNAFFKTMTQLNNTLLGIELKKKETKESSNITSNQPTSYLSNLKSTRITNDMKQASYSSLNKIKELRQSISLNNPNKLDVSFTNQSNRSRSYSHEDINNDNLINSNSSNNEMTRSMNSMPLDNRIVINNNKQRQADEPLISNNRINQTTNKQSSNRAADKDITSINSSSRPISKLPREIDKEIDKESSFDLSDSISVNSYSSLLTNREDHLDKKLIDKTINNIDSYKYTLDSRIDNRLDSKVDSKPDNKLDSKIDSYSDNRINSTLDTKHFITTEEMFNNSANRTLDNQSVSKFVAKVDYDTDSTLDSKEDDKFDSKLDCRVDSNLADKIDSNIYMKIDSKLDSKFNKRDDKIDSKIEDDTASKLFTKISSTIDDFTVYNNSIKNINTNSDTVNQSNDYINGYTFDRSNETNPLDRRIDSQIVDKIDNKVNINSYIDSYIDRRSVNNVNRALDAKDIREAFIKQYDDLMAQSLKNKLELDKQLDRQSDKQLHKQVDRQIDKQLYSQGDRQLDNQVDKHVDRQIDNLLYGQTDRQIDKRIDSSIDRQSSSNIKENLKPPDQLSNRSSDKKTSLDLSDMTFKKMKELIGHY